MKKKTISRQIIFIKNYLDDDCLELFETKKNLKNELLIALKN